jgi:hypothetical protein
VVINERLIVENAILWKPMGFAFSPLAKTHLSAEESASIIIYQGSMRGTGETACLFDGNFTGF